MPSAKTGPDRKHALEALGQLWVFPPSGVDRISHYFMSALPNLVGQSVPGLMSLRLLVRGNVPRWS
jgi:hypothetical protein